MEGKLDLVDLQDFDRMPKIEAKVAFISVAAWALSMLGDYDSLPDYDQKAWEGLAWFTEEIKDDLAKINKGIAGSADQ